MKLLLPMAYVFFVLKESVVITGKPLATNDNLTYRLMEIETENGNENDETHTESYTYPEQNYYPPQYIIPRVPEDVVPFEGRNNYVNEIRENKASTVRMPSEIEEEISRFQIPVARLPPRIIRKPKEKKNSFKTKKKIKKGTEKSKSENKETDENETDDEFDQQEEEEETEEKKEKIHKVTIKKKRPFKNGTRTDSPAQPYRTIPESSYDYDDRGQAFGQPYRKPFVPKMRGSQSNPLMVKENVQVLNPAYYHHDQSVRKGIKPRDVNVILRSKHRSPRIMIRRYKPVIGTAIAYPFLNQPAAAIIHGRRKKRRKKQRKRKKLRKPHREVDADFLPHSPYVANQASCSNEHPQMVNSFPPPSDHFDGIYPYQPESDYHAKFPVISQPMSDYVNVPYENNEYASEPFTSAVPISTELPFPEKSEHVSKEESMSVPYDMREHENTEELAASHKQETDESLDEENEPTVQYEDDDTESGEGENGEYENDSDESDSFFDTTTQRPIKKIDQR